MSRSCWAIGWGGRRHGWGDNGGKGSPTTEATGAAQTGSQPIPENLQRILQLLRPPQPGISTDATRGMERHRRALLTSMTAIAARALGMGSSLITIPLTLHYLANERFGLWMTISSVVAMASF